MRGYVGTSYLLNNPGRMLPPDSFRRYWRCGDKEEMLEMHWTISSPYPPQIPISPFIKRVGELPEVFEMLRNIDTMADDGRHLAFLRAFPGSTGNNESSCPKWGKDRREQHWLAHGRHWVNKSGTKPDPGLAWDVCQEVFDVLPGLDRYEAV